MKSIILSLSLTSVIVLVYNKLSIQAPLQDVASAPVKPTESPRVSKLSDDNDGTPLPRIAWLMSFPNSGTSFTMTMVQRVSLRTTASNYAKETQGSNQNSIPVHAGPGALLGPFWQNLTNLEREYERPTSFVLTKTHCGGRCNQCAPSRYIETPYSFLTQCLSGSRGYESASGAVTYKDVTYDPSIVSSAVHLIRNPFDNIVSRFHHARKRHPSVAESYPNTREGFRAFCHGLDGKYAHEEEESRFVDSKLLDIVKDVPCHADFFRYVQWHNLAFITTEELGIPVHMLHYENYEDNYEKTVDGLLSFLDLERKGEMMNFIKGKEYSEFFEKDEQEAVKVVMEKVASRKTWANIKHYF